MDYLEIVEDKLRQVRKDRGITPSSLVGKGYKAPTIYRIERHSNYNINTLFSLIAEYGLELSINGVRVGDKQALGVAIRERRQQLGLSQLTVIFKTGLSSSRIISVEHGRNYWKKTLNAYLAVLNSTITINEKETTISEYEKALRHKADSIT